MRDLAETLPRLIKPPNNHLFLLVHMRTSIARTAMRQIVEDYEALGQEVKEFDAQTVFSLLFPVEGCRMQREKNTRNE